MIRLDVKVGDTILMGRFKNKKVKIEDLDKILESYRLIDIKRI